MGSVRAKAVRGRVLKSNPSDKAVNAVFLNEGVFSCRVKNSSEEAVKKRPRGWDMNDADITIKKGEDTRKIAAQRPTLRL